MAKRLSMLFSPGFSFSTTHLPNLSPAKEEMEVASSDHETSPPDIKSRSRSPGGKLRRKQQPESISRRTPTIPQTKDVPTIPNLQELQDGDITAPLPPPPTNAGTFIRSFSGNDSRPGTPNSMSYSRPSTPTLVVPHQRTSTPSSFTYEDQSQKRKSSWFGKSSKQDQDTTRGPLAWIAGHPQKLPYDTSGLLSARPELELCNHTDGDCFVYLWPRSAGKGASFKVPSSIFAASPVLTKLAYGESEYSGDRNQESGTRDPTTPPLTPKDQFFPSSKSSSHGSSISGSRISSAPRDYNLYVPLNLSGDDSSTKSDKSQSKGHKSGVTDDLQKLIDVRNLFAFLCGQSLIATERRSSIFSIFMSISDLLKMYDFTNIDGSTYGEVASVSFENYVEELKLADVRNSPEKMIDGIVLGEHMKSVGLFNEAFTHGAGRYEDLVALRSPKFLRISNLTQNRLVIAARDLDRRIARIREILTEFSFPSLFSGIMNSKMSEERKEGVRFEAWKDAFLGTRKCVLTLLQRQYGHWPPKASSKKNDLETSGLNRLVLLDLYRDMSDLYDLLVDRSNLTTRTVDGISNEGGTREEPLVRALRSVLSEYDRSSPPVKPPVPFDLPRLPTLSTVRPDYGRPGNAKHDGKAALKRLKEEDISQLLHASWNPDASLTPFVNAFLEMEKRAAHGCTMLDLQNQRVGQWIFMYAVLQALPMLVVDAPALNHTDGVEYFLCEPPRSGVPWATTPHSSHTTAATQSASNRTWFTVGAGQGLVALPSDLVEHGVEGIYRRSHCWQMATHWAGATLPPPSSAPATDPYIDEEFSRRASCINLGLEALPPHVNRYSEHLGVPTLGASPAEPQKRRSRTQQPPRHSVDAAKTFDAILADVPPVGSKQRKVSPEAEGRGGRRLRAKK